MNLKQNPNVKSGWILKSFKKILNSGKLCKRSLHLTTVSLLVLQMTLLPFGNLSFAQEPPSENETNGTEQIIRESLSDPQSRSENERLNQAIDEIENGIRPGPFQLMRLGQQWLEVRQSNGRFEKFDLSSLSVSLPTVTYTSLRVHADPEKSEIVIYAIKADRIVARHHIGDLDVAAIATDNELVSILDRQGRLHLLDMGIVTTLGFNTPIPVVTNVWESPTPFTGQIDARYLSAGVQPPSPEELQSETAVIPKTAAGKVVFTAGDLIVRESNSDGTSKLVGIFSRQKSYARLLEATAFLHQLILLVTPTSESTQKAVLAMTKYQNAKTDLALKESQENMSELERSALATFDTKQLNILRERFREIDGAPQSEVDGNPYIEHDKGLANRTFDKFSYEEWQNRFAKYVDMAKTQIEDIREAEGKLNDAGQALEESLKIGDLTPNWQDFEKSPEPVERKFWRQENISRGLKILGGIAGGSLALYNIYPTETIQTLALIYEVYYPSVLKDADYRIILGYSSVSLLAIIPAAHYLSKFTGPLLFGLGKFLADGSVVKGTVRDLYEKWVPLEAWSRIVSFGMRVYAVLLYPIWNPLFKLVLRQPTMLNALENGLNPLTRITPDSKIGQSFEIEESERIGVSNPFILDTEKNKKSSSQKLKLQTAVKMQKKKTEALAWLLATMVVSQESGVDLATILTAENGLSIDQLRDVLSNPKTEKLWKLSAEGIYQQLASMQAISWDEELSKMDPRRIAEYHSLAQEVVQQLQSKTQLTQTLRSLALKFKTGLKNVPNKLFSFGREDANFLKTVFANDFVSSQVKKEFRQDHVLVVLLMALVGERADLSHPEHLAADADGLLWTSGPHLTDVIHNVLLHFFVAGSRMALVYQGKVPVTESNYAPLENYSLKPAPRYRGVWSTFWDWTKVINPAKADMGYIMWKAFVKRMATIQAGLIMGVLGRVALTDQSLVTSLIGHLYVVLACQWYFGWVWDPVQRGINLQGDKLNNKKDQLQEAIRRLSVGMRQIEDAKESNELIEKGSRDLYSLFDRENPKAIRFLHQTFEQEIMRLVEQFKLSPEMADTYLGDSERKYLGLAGRLALALQKNQKSPEVDINDVSQKHHEVYEARKALEDALIQKESLSREELSQLTARNLLDFAMQNSPVYTHVSGLPSEALIFTASMLSTYLAIPLSVNSFTDDYLTMRTLAEWTGLGLGLHGIAYLALGAKPWAFYLRQIEKVSKRIGINPRPVLDRIGFKKVEPQPKKLSEKIFHSLTCESVFATH